MVLDLSLMLFGSMSYRVWRCFLLTACSLMAQYFGGIVLFVNWKTQVGFL